MAAELQTNPETLESEVKKVRRQLDNLLELAAESGDRSLLIKIKEKEDLLDRLAAQRIEWVERAALRQRLETIDAKDIRYIIALNGLELSDGEPRALDLLGYEDKDRMGSIELRRIIVALLSRID